LPIRPHDPKGRATIGRWAARTATPSASKTTPARGSDEADIARRAAPTTRATRAPLVVDRRGHVVDAERSGTEARQLVTRLQPLKPDITRDTSAYELLLVI
jgi:hypothetical protein